MDLEQQATPPTRVRELVASWRITVWVAFAVCRSAGHVHVHDHAVAVGPKLCLRLKPSSLGLEWLSEYAGSEGPITAIIEQARLVD